MKPFLFLTAALTILAIGCSGVTVNLPTMRELELGPTQTYSIDEPLPAGSDPVALTLSMGAGSLDVRGGAQNLVEGSVRCNVPSWKLVVDRSANQIDIRQEAPEGYTTPTGSSVVNEWEVRLGAHPLDLHVNAGAYRGTLDLSGVPLRSLEVLDGASESQVVFSSPNPQRMEELVYRTGASTVELRGLGYARAKQITFVSGAGTYTLDFTGEASEPTTVSIRSGVSTVRLIVPANANARLSLGGGLREVSSSGAWIGSGNFYNVVGDGIELELNVDMGVGQLILETR
ncbi:MAG TPA: toast rack family protein [Anaerolineales bacterium]|nr:toast rack family protein [Anaerolineales bacterium]